jgi:hypothetical protein
VLLERFLPDVHLHELAEAAVPESGHFARVIIVGFRFLPAP